MDLETLDKSQDERTVKLEIDEMRYDRNKISGEYLTKSGSDAIPTYRSSSLPVTNSLSVQMTLPAKDEETRRLLCSHVLDTGRRSGNHDRKDQGDRENHTIRKVVILHRRYRERERVRREKNKA